MLVYVFFKSLFAGPLGEELGWRGFAQNELQKKHSPLTASLIVGFWWGLWHLPIWFTTGYTGGQLLAYMGCFMVAIMSISIIIAAFYHLNQNLWIPIIIHQLFNFFIGIVNGDGLTILRYTALLYFFAALILIIVNPKKALYGKKRSLLSGIMI